MDAFAVGRSSRPTRRGRSNAGRTVRSHRRHSFASSAAQYTRAPREAHASQGSLIVATLSDGERVTVARKSHLLATTVGYVSLCGCPRRFRTGQCGSTVRFGLQDARGKTSRRLRRRRRRRPRRRGRLRRCFPEREASNGVFGIQGIRASVQLDDVWSFSVRSHLASEERPASVVSRTG